MFVGSRGVGVTVGGTAVAVSVGVGVAVGGTAVADDVSVGVGEAVVVGVAVGGWLGVMVGVTVGVTAVAVADGVSVGVVVGVLVGGMGVAGTGVLVGGSAVGGTAVGVNVAAASGGRKMTCPAASAVVFTQFAASIAAMVVWCVVANENMVSPGCTTYCTHSRGGPQGWRVGGVGGR